MNRQRTREARWLLAAPMVPATLAGLPMVFLALDHNPQGAFFDGDRFYFGAVFSIFYSWFAPIYLVFLAVALVLYPVYRLGLASGFVDTRSDRSGEIASPGEIRLVVAMGLGAVVVAMSYAAAWASTLH